MERSDGRKGGRPAYPTEVMVRILVLKRLYNLSDEQMQFQLLDGMSYQRFCLLQDSMNVPDRNTIWRFGERICVDGAMALLRGVDAQLHRYGFIARGGQAIDATLVPAPVLHIGKDDRSQLAAGETPEWSDAKRRQKDLDARIPKSMAKATLATSSVSASITKMALSVVLRQAQPASTMDTTLTTCLTKATRASKWTPTKAIPASKGKPCSKHWVLKMVFSAKRKRTSP